ncbi:unnamed protein product [Sphagnum jensenii]|uniref:Uncharacterized protein n=1 Tax=Sphagnum jensenii TaxID=128206 RepID=A0ABP0WFQ1_9BRYO
MVADTSKFSGVDEKRLRMEMAERKQAVENMISDTGRLKACAQKKVKLSAPISPGALPRSVVVREAESLHATWVILDRFVFRELLHVAPAAGPPHQFVLQLFKGLLPLGCCDHSYTEYAMII